MADHPLRPATDRRLGGPLPRQLANQTQDPLLAPGLAVPRFHLQHSSQRSHAVLPLLSERYSPLKGRFPTRYSPVCHAPCGTSDLHVLGTPPAFILSQDQTLKFNIPELSILGVSPSDQCSGRISLNPMNRPRTLHGTLKGFLSSIRFSKTPPCLSTRSGSATSLPLAPRSLNCAGHLD